MYGSPASSLVHLVEISWVFHPRCPLVLCPVQGLLNFQGQTGAVGYGEYFTFYFSKSDYADVVGG